LNIELVSFRLFDLDGDGFIDKEELFNMLQAALLESSDIELSEAEMRDVVNNTFKEVDSNGDELISFDEYKTLMSNQQMDFLTVRIIPEED
jgi:Ca2+-binding EF-hand superfamily protein